ncbi:hypothetical protein ABTN02_20500, partial [Acinetobacter baumannii]
MLTVDPDLDARLASAGRDDARPADALGEDAVRGIVQAVADGAEAALVAGVPPVLLCSAEARPALKDLTRADLP